MKKGMDMFKKMAVLGLGIALCASVSQADGIYEPELPMVWASIITLSGGPAWTSPGQNQYLYPSAVPYYNYYHYNSKTSTVANGELFFGLERVIFPQIIGQLGLGVAGSSDAKVTGFNAINGVVDVSTYEYKVNHARLELKGKLIANSFQMAQPYVSASLGAGWNNAHDYRPTTLYPLYTPSWFTSNTTISFAYSLGVGLQTMVTPHWQVGAGYEFADLGKSYLGGDNSSLDKGLRLTHLYTNELLFSLSYLFS